MAESLNKPLPPGSGIAQIVPVPNEWIKVIAPGCDQIIFEPGNFDLADNSDPGDIYFHVSELCGALTVPAPAADTVFWVRSISTDPINYIWTVGL